MKAVPWDTWSGLPGPTAYLDRRYFEAMSDHGKVQCRIGLLHDRDGRCVGGIQMQSVLSESRNPGDHLEVSLGVRLFMGLLQPGGRPFRFRTLVAGQGLGTGEHTFRWEPKVALEDRIRLTEQAFEECAEHWGIRVWMAKDFGPELDAAIAPHWSRKWQRATFDPVMVTPLDPTWTDREQWMEALRTKARTKVRSILARNANVTLERVTDTAHLRALGPDLIALYEQVYGRASIVMGGLEAPDFAHLAEQWEDDFLLVTHHFEGRMVGFHCGLHLAEAEGRAGTVEAYFVGVRTGPEQGIRPLPADAHRIHRMGHFKTGLPGGHGPHCDGDQKHLGRTPCADVDVGAHSLALGDAVHPLDDPAQPAPPLQTEESVARGMDGPLEAEGFGFNSPVPPGPGR